MKESILLFIVIALVILAGLSSYFGKNLPKAVWWISLVSAGLVGFVIAALVAPFPDNLALGACISVGTVLLTIVFRITRMNHPR